MKNWRSCYIGFSVAALLVAGCSSTQFTSTWKSPDATLAHLVPGSKVGALVMYPQTAVQRSAEDALAAELTKRGLQGIPAYTLLGDTGVMKEDAAKAAFAKSGAEAVVVMRGIVHETQINYMMPTYANAPTYGSFWGGYYGAGWGGVADPAYLQASHVITVETLVFDLKANKLIWAGRSRSVDPGKLSTFITEVADEAAKEMRKDGVI